MINGQINLAVNGLAGIPQRHFAAIVFDLDGTAVPNTKDGTPSLRVIEAIRCAQLLMPICAATGRPWSVARHVLQRLQLTSPCIISGGAQIIDPRSEKVLWERLIHPVAARRALAACSEFDYEVLIDNEVVGEGAKASQRQIDHGPYVMYIMSAKSNDAAIMLNRLRSIDELEIHDVTSRLSAGTFDLHITHREGTKAHAGKQLFEMLNVDPAQVICVGDANNDIPLLGIVGFKVAMGNATAELKALADMICPSVNQDGLAQCIEWAINATSIPQRAENE